MKKVALDPLKCTACRTCELQCSIAHSRSGDLYSAIFESPPSLSRIRVSWTPGLNVPVRCVHCENAPCVAACPVGAITQDGRTGTVQTMEERCIGCFTCVLVCPYGAVRLSYDRKKACKCDGCRDRLGRGLEPACASGCPTNALSYADFDDIVQAKISEAAAREAAAQARADRVAPREPSSLERILEMRKEIARG
ncbi:MAG: 4Fe-4S dicluster domain-containing protein [Deltaproteobacteria bacterium]|nr:4Fe-4S dicluster domain-containing protein [Deltaproteobacteria bacterium]